MGPSLAVMEIIGTGDPALFEHLLVGAGFEVLGLVENDPLSKSVQEEVVASIASTLTEEVHEYVELTPYEEQLKLLAEDLGYVVALREFEDEPIPRPNLARSASASIKAIASPMNPQTARWYMLAKKLKAAYPDDAEVDLLHKAVGHLDNVERRATTSPPMAKVAADLTNTVRQLVIKLVKKYPMSEGLDQHPGTDFDPFA